jgi:hypothetical protein
MRAAITPLARSQRRSGTSELTDYPVENSQIPRRGKRHNGSLTNVAEELIVSARWAPAFGESGGRDEDNVRDSNCRCCIEHRASRGCRFGQIPAGRTILSTAATGVAGVQLDRMLSGRLARRRLRR